MKSFLTTFLAVLIAGGAIYGFHEYRERHDKQVLSSISQARHLVDSSNQMAEFLGDQTDPYIIEDIQPQIAELKSPQQIKLLKDIEERSDFPPSLRDDAKTTLQKIEALKLQAPRK